MVRWGRKLCGRVDNQTQIFQELGNHLSHRQPSEESLPLLATWHFTRNWTKKKKKKCKPCPFTWNTHFQFVTSSPPCLYCLNFTSFTEKTATVFAKRTLTVCWFLLDSELRLSRLEDMHTYTPLVLLVTFGASCGIAALEGSNKALSYYLLWLWNASRGNLNLRQVLDRQIPLRVALSFKGNILNLSEGLYILTPDSTPQRWSHKQHQWQPFYFTNVRYEPV